MAQPLEAKSAVRIIRPSAERNSLPPYIQNAPDNKVKIVGGIKEGKEGPYDVVFDYGTTKHSLKAAVPMGDRIRRNIDITGMEFVGLGNARVMASMHNITEINAQTIPSEEGARYSYQQNLDRVFQPISDRVRTLVGVRQPLYFPPLRGADVVRAMFVNNGFEINEGNMVDYELKRVLLKDEIFLVGANFARIPKGRFDTAVFIDDCLASDVSASATIHSIIERLPEVKKVIVAVAAATQRGMESLRKEFKDSGLDLHLIAGVPVFAMSDDYYMLRTPGEGYPAGLQFVGDMGSWSGKLPESYNVLAPWNRFRS